MTLRFLPPVAVAALVLAPLPAQAAGQTPPAPAQREAQTLGRLTRQVTGELTLTKAVGIALGQNPDILKAIQDLQRSRGFIIEVRAEALPQLSLNANYDTQESRLNQTFDRGATQGSEEITLPDTIDPAFGAALGPIFAALSGTGQPGSREIPDQTYNISLQVSQLLYSGGRVRASIAAAKFAEDSAYYQFRDVLDQVITRTRSQFYSILTNRALITVQEETVRLQQDLLQDQRNRFEAGTVPRFNVIRAEVELANVIPNLIRARNDYLIAQIDLAKTLGLDPGPGGRPTFECVGTLGVPGRALSLVDSLSLAKARRPFLKAQRRNILSQAERVKGAHAGYKPTLRASAGYQIRNSSFSDNLDQTIDGWFIGVQGNWNLFDGFATTGRVKQERALLEQAKINYDDSVQQVELEVQQAYARVQQGREVVESQRKNIEQARESLRLANERLSAGAGTQLEVLDARVALTAAQTTELQARSDYNKALAEFDRVTGTDTVYDDPFKDPLRRLEEKIIGDGGKWDFHPLKKVIDPDIPPLAPKPAGKRSER
ncbi:MAG: TolC family protein [Verrucomicrobiota bacterium]|nr:TolC family protein [Verrucomicrobiota bacterium]